ncbi:MAG: alpha/beta hydrolase [Candidatus Aenigmatarchaeota archaeon]
MKKVSFTVEDENIIGIWHTPVKESSLGIIMIHGFKGDKDERDRFVKIGQIFADNGFHVLRIDCRGSGESDGEFIDMNILTEVADTLGAVQYMKRKGIKRVGLFGHSLGGEVVLLASLAADVRGVVVTAPATYSDNLLKHLTPSNVEDLEKKGYIIIISKSSGKPFMVNKRFFQVVKKINIEEKLKDVKKPVLIIHGNEDKNIPVHYSEEAYEKLGGIKELHIINGTDHEFAGYLEEIAGLATKWFEKTLN